MRPDRPFGRKTALIVTLVLAQAGPTSAATPRIAIPPGLQQAAILCLGEALRLCPDALAAKDHGLACIVGKRRLLSKPCRGVYDQGVSFLKGGDVHLDLRASRHHPPPPLVVPRAAPAPSTGEKSPEGG